MQEKESCPVSGFIIYYEKLEDTALRVCPAHHAPAMQIYLSYSDHATGGVLSVRLNPASGFPCEFEDLAILLPSPVPLTGFGGQDIT
jgi:hypothetical protein